MPTSPKPKPAPKRTNRPRQRPRGLTVAQVANALRLNGGIRALAARALKVDRSTITHFAKKHPEIVEIEAEIVAELVDLSQAKLIEQINKGEFPAIKYFLDHKGQDAGFGLRRVQLSTEEGKPLEFKEQRPDYSGLSLDEKRELAALMRKAKAASGDDAIGS